MVDLHHAAQRKLGHLPPVHRVGVGDDRAEAQDGLHELDELLRAALHRYGLFPGGDGDGLGDLLLLIGLGIGWVNGVIVTKLGVPPFIATLGTMYIFRGFANLRSNGATFSELSGYEALGNTGFKALGSDLFGIPCGVYIFAALAVLAAVLLRKTSFGWYVKAVGGNERSARLSGIKADKIKILVYMISGFCAVWAGLINTAQLSAAHPATGDGWEMNAIAATVLGGTSMAGGSGTVVGTVIGAFVIGVINDGMTMCGVSEFWQKVIRGAVIIAAVVIDQAQRNLQARMALQARSGEVK